MKICVVDHYYPDFLSGWGVRPERGYAAELNRLLEFSFGTADFCSRGLREHGNEVVDIVANASALQTLWAKETGFGGTNLKAIALQQIEEFGPDVLFVQNLSWFSPLELESLGQRYLLAGQCSCPMPAESNVRKFRLLATSFPHYVTRFEAMGVKAIFNALAFDPVVLERIGPISGERSGCVFVGGVGKNSHWRYGTEVLETVAANIPEFTWYGYGVENLAADSPLRKCYRGTAFGLDMYRVMAKSEIVLNRHGEVSGDYANNMRMFEVTGCGAMLLTDKKSNLGDYFEEENEAIDYSNPFEAVDEIKYFLENHEHCAEVAAAGQRRTLADHTYNISMGKISDTLREML